MNKKKNIILSAIIVAALAVAGFLVYKMLSKPSGTSLLPVTVVESAPAEDILPLGDQLDLTPVKKISSQFNVYSTTKVTPGSIGVSVSDLIKNTNDTK